MNIFYTKNHWMNRGILLLKLYCVWSDLPVKSKRQVRGYIEKYFEGIINNLEKTDEERTTLLRQISEVTATTETDKQLPLQKQKDDGSPHGGNIGLLRDLELLNQTGLQKREFKIRRTSWGSRLEG